MAHSEKVLMSQKFSSFTILGSLLGNSDMYYLYDDKESRIKKLNIQKYKNFKYFCQ